MEKKYRTTQKSSSESNTQNATPNGFDNSGLSYLGVLSVTEVLARLDIHEDDDADAIEQSLIRVAVGGKQLHVRIGDTLTHVLQGVPGAKGLLRVWIPSYLVNEVVADI